MKQLVELRRNAEKFDNADVEVIVVFREESKGVDGLKIIKEKSKSDFTLALDTPKKLTADYSPGKKEFTNYVIDKSGVIQGIIKGDLKNRAKSQQLLDIVASLASDSTGSSAPSDRDAVERAMLDYVEGIYEVKPEFIERSVHPDLQKFGYGRSRTAERGYNPGTAMTFKQLVDLAGKYNKDGSRVPADAPKKVEIFDVQDKIASGKLTAAWGSDFFHLVKEDGKWKILQIVWQSRLKK